MKIYIDLFHGRNDPAQDMEDWGFSGPIIGPFDYVSFTYLSYIRCNDKSGEVLDILIKDDMIFYDGKYYGDFCIFHEDYFIENPSQKTRIVDFKAMCLCRSPSLAIPLNSSNKCTDCGKPLHH